MECSPVYLITGCSSGLGFLLAKTAPSTGARVIATARNPQQNPGIYESLSALGAMWMPLDLLSDGVDQQLSSAVATYGRVDVLINDAGYGSAGPVEEVALVSAQRTFDTNFWGPVRCIRGVLPVMRKHSSGVIVNISSASVYDLAPGVAFYAASKAALEVMTASIAPEIASFGIRIILVTPADMRTPFVAADKKMGLFSPLSEAYVGGPVEATYGFLKEMDGKQTIDPSRAAEEIIRAANRSLEPTQEMFFWLPIGKNAGASITNRCKIIEKAVRDTEDIWAKVDFPVD